MANLIRIDDADDPRLGDYVGLREATLRRLLETERGVFIAEGSKVIRRAVEAGYPPRSFLLAERWLADLARLRDRSSGRTVLVLNVHAHPVQTVQMARVRALGITRLVAVVRELDPKLAEPLVLMGDFNAGDKESRPVFRDHLTALSELGLADTAALAARDASDVPNANSLNKLTAQVAGVEVAKVVRRTARHVDYVWVPSRTEVSTWQVLSGPGVRWQRVRGERVPTWPGIIASDHSPVIAEFTFG